MAVILIGSSIWIQVTSQTVKVDITMIAVHNNAQVIRFLPNPASFGFFIIFPIKNINPELQKISSQSVPFLVKNPQRIDAIHSAFSLHDVMPM